jgi:hypothetical protein
MAILNNRDICWLFGYLVIWLFGYLVIWLFGYFSNRTKNPANVAGFFV